MPIDAMFRDDPPDVSCPAVYATRRRTISLIPFTLTDLGTGVLSEIAVSPVTAPTFRLMQTKPTQERRIIAISGSITTSALVVESYPACGKRCASAPGLASSSRPACVL